MQTHTRALIAAAAFACVTGRKVAGIYDHTAGQDLRIAAERRGDQVQGFDGERGARFGGTLPELYDSADKSFVSFAVEGNEVSGYDRSSSTHYTARVTDGVVQLYDHGASAWFAYDIQDEDAAAAYHRSQ